MFSPSEIDSLKACEMKHYYAFGEQLMATDTTEGIARGNAGHAALAAYYSTFLGKNPKNQLEFFEEAKANMSQALLAWLKENPVWMTLGPPLMNLLDAWADANMHELTAWEVIAVEHTFEVGDAAFTPDLIVRDRFKETKVVDHKILYNFYSDTVMELSPQLSRYAGLLRRQGLPVKLAEYNMLRHRADAKIKFKRGKHTLTPSKVEKHMADMDSGGARILALKSLPLPTWQQSITTSASTFTCDHCQFTSICLTDLEGRPGRENLMRTFYKPNTYGYVKRDNENANA